MQFFNRSVYFLNGKAVGTHPIYPGATMVVMQLPSDHYDFLGPVSILGKTKAQIEAEVKTLPI